jgi:ATP-dependent helicase/nuclease subunit A
LRAARAVDALETLTDGVGARVRRALDVPADFDGDHIPNLCCDDRVDRELLLDLARTHSAWGTKTGQAAVETVSNWLLGSPAQRAAELGKLSSVWLTGKGEFRQIGPKDPGYPALIEQLHGWCSELQDLAARAALADDIAHALLAARRYARAYADAKRANGFVDFDDLIQKAVALLTTPGMGAWIGYKLDQVTDHILVDEA